MRQDKNYQKLAILIAVLFVASIVPIIILMFYAHPFADEYTETVEVYYALKTGKGILGMLKGGWDNMVYSYFNWQGTYSAEFVMAMNPSVLGDKYYYLGILPVFIMLLLNHFFFLYVLLCRILKLQKSEWLIVSCISFLVGVHFMPDPMQGIYWYESSSYYMGFYGFGLLSLTLCLLSVINKQTTRAYVYMILSCITGFITAGGNMQSGMLFSFAFLSIIIIGLYLKNKDSFRAVPVFAVFLIGFIISITAPGNAIRGKGSFSGIGPLMTIYKALHQSCVLLDEWRNIFLVSLLIGLILPICLRAVKRIDFKYPYPAFVTLYLFGMFSCQFAPSYYAYDMIGPLRTVNPIYFSFILLLILCIYYWCGWIMRIAKEKQLVESIDVNKLYEWYFPKGIIVTAFVFCLGCISSDRMSYITGVSALTSLVTGEAKAYDTERLEREQLYLANEGLKTDVEIEELTAKPYLLYLEDGEPKENSTRWINVGISKYYQFNSLKMKKNYDD